MKFFKMKKTGCLFLFFLFILLRSSSGQGIYNTANIVANGPVFILIQDGGFHNDGNFSPGSGTLMLSGTASPGISTIGGSSLTPFQNLTIQKTSGGASLSGDISISGNLVMQSGNLDLNQHNIDLGNAGGTILNETNISRITGLAGGFILKTVDLDAPSMIDAGNIGIAISSAANLGITTIKRGHQQQTSLSGGISIDRFFDIAPANNSALDATLQMFYFDGELAGINKDELNFYKSEDGGTSWMFIGEDNANTTQDWVLKNGIDQLSRWTLASDITNPLPVTIISFTAKLAGTKTDLQWTTEQEENSSYFEIQRSFGSGAFTKILQVPALGNSTTPHTYRAIDNSPETGIDYYRLKEVDKDGKYIYSSIVSVTFSAENSLQVYPNPVTDKFFVNINVAAQQKINLRLYDITGKLVSTKQILLNAGSNLQPWDISSLASGVYLLKSDELERQPIQIIKQ